MTERTDVANCLYLFHLTGRLATRVNRGSGAPEYQLLSQYLQVPSAWNYLHHHLYQWALREPDSPQMWEDLRAVRKNVDTLLGGRRRRPLSLVPKSRDIRILLSGSAKNSLSRATAYSFNEVLDRVFDGRILKEILTELGAIDSQANYPSSILLDLVLQDSNIRRAQQEDIDLFETLEEALVPGARNALRKYFKDCYLSPLRCLVQETISTTAQAAIEHATTRAEDVFAEEKLRQDLGTIKSAVESVALERIRMAQESVPRSRLLWLLRFLCEVELAGDYRKASSLLALDRVPLRALDILIEDRELPTLPTGGRLTARRPKGSILGRVMGTGERSQDQLEILWTSPSGSKTLIATLTIGDRDALESVEGEFGEGVEVKDLPAPGRPLKERIRELGVIPPGKLKQEFEWVAESTEEYAVALELMSLDILGSAESFEEILSSELWQKPEETEDWHLEGLMPAEDFLNSFEAESDSS